MFAAALDRVDIVRLLVARKADTSLASTFVDLKALALPEPPTAQSGRAAAAVGGGAGPEEAPAARGAKKPPQIAGVDRPYRYNELIGAQGGLTALHFAARQGNLESVEALVEGGANVNALSPADRTTPLLIATINGQFDLAMYLLEHGADPNLSSEAGTTPLYAVVNVQWAPIAAYPQPRAYLQQRHAYLDLMRALLDKGAEPNARINRKIWYRSYNFDQSNVDEAGATAFWRAAYAADVDAMRLLVTHGADPRSRRRASPSGATRTTRTARTCRDGRGTDRRTEHAGAAGRGRPRLQQRLRRQLAPSSRPAACWRRSSISSRNCTPTSTRRDADGNTALHNAAVARRQRDDSVPRLPGRRRHAPSTASARPRSTSPTGRCSACSRSRRRSRCSRSSARRTTTSACRAETGDAEPITTETQSGSHRDTEARRTARAR